MRGGTWLACKPRVALFERFLPIEICNELIEIIMPRMNSTRLHASASSVRRSSSGCWLMRSDTVADSDKQIREAQIIEFVEKKISDVTSIPIDHGEPLQALRYLKGQEYTLHPDFFDPQDRNELKNGGQRVATFLIYLSTVPVEAGGATVFPRAIDLGTRKRKLRVQPVAGSALLWYNTLQTGEPDVRSMHRSMRIKQPSEWAPADGTEQGEARQPVKWVLSKWLRRRPYRVSDDRTHRIDQHRVKQPPYPSDQRILRR
mmetsp:Transcript_12734/g.27208  ORF Transcript_12734/g.27208 Transcript_12734/m.27208 type:complete len:259 (+) Transcript_12734:169-945(+)